MSYYSCPWNTKTTQQSACNVFVQVRHQRAMMTSHSHFFSFSFVLTGFCFPFSVRNARTSVPAKLSAIRVVVNKICLLSKSLSLALDDSLSAIELSLPKLTPGTQSPTIGVCFFPFLHHFPKDLPNSYNFLRVHRSRRRCSEKPLQSR